MKSRVETSFRSAATISSTSAARSTMLSRSEARRLSLVVWASGWRWLLAMNVRKGTGSA